MRMKDRIGPIKKESVSTDKIRDRRESQKQKYKQIETREIERPNGGEEGDTKMWENKR